MFYRSSNNRLKLLLCLEIRGKAKNTICDENFWPEEVARIGWSETALLIFKNALTLHAKNLDCQRNVARSLQPSHCEVDYARGCSHEAYALCVRNLTVTSTRNSLNIRPVTSLAHWAGRIVFWEGPKLFKLCPIVLNYFQYTFPGGQCPLSYEPAKDVSIFLRSSFTKTKRRFVRI